MLATKPKIVSLKTSNNIAPNAPMPDKIPQGERLRIKHSKTIKAIIIISSLKSCK